MEGGEGEWGVAVRRGGVRSEVDGVERGGGTRGTGSAWTMRELQPRGLACKLSHKCCHTNFSVTVGQWKWKV